MIALDISELSAGFPGFRVALLVAEGLAIPAAVPPAVSALLAAAEAEAAEALAGRELAELPELAAWRAAYKAFGVKKTSYRCSVERLLKAVARGEGLPRVNALVDLYNAVSVRHRLPVGADDLARVTPPLAFRFAREGDSFVALGDPAATPDPPKPGEVVYADAAKCLCRRWNWYQDARSAIRPDTAAAVLTVQGLGPSAGRVEAAAAELAGMLEAECGARVAWAVAEAGRPRIEV
ncbi:MAG: phenylalanine--tRNA ligase beta subunit-related protein [Dongiaceae bacterium]